MDLGGLQSLLDRVNGVTVACVGDLMLDRYVMGEVSRISPEAPIPVLKGLEQVEMLGAAGNVARNVTSLGGRARLGGIVGTDAAAGVIVELIAADPGISPHLDHVEGGVTTIKTRFVAQGQQLLRLDQERPCSVDYGYGGAQTLAVTAETRAVLISDYAKGAVDDSLIGSLHFLNRHGAPMIVDPKGRDFARYGAVELIKPNALELSVATGLPTETDTEIAGALTAVLDLCEARAIVVTRAGKGMSLMWRGGEVRHFPGRAREVFDVSGAGDTVLAALGLALAAGAALEEAIEFAILASGVVVAKRGTAVVTPAELIDAEMTGHAAIAHAKVTPLDVLANEVEAWKRQGLKVGFTNGCFDVLHRGHVAYLAQARGWCDRLIVALNTDASVRQLKGEGRPVNDLDSRAVVIGSLSSVDRVTAFDDETPIALIERLRPDVLIKGADYAREEVIGGDLVESWGGEVRLARFEEGFSTTATLARGARVSGAAWDAR